LAPSFTYASSDVKSSTSTKAPSKSSAKPADAPTAGDVVRLTKSVKPESYELSFEPNLRDFTYKGSESILLNIAAPTKEITLNALEMNITSVEIESADGSGKSTAKIEMDAKNEQAHFQFDTTLKPGKYKLKVNFDSILNDQLRGFYRSYFKDASGEKHWMCSSQMEPSDARRMFPCFDEPEFKATFQISAVIDANLAAISNAPIERTIDSADKSKKTVVFEPTPKMSTYLLVLVVGDMKSTEERTSMGVPIRVWAPAGQEKMGEYSLGAACEIMKFLSDYFGIKYPAKKLDLIAIADFAPGAMENLGAITFKDSLLLIDDKTGTSFARRNAFSVTAHEMAHQWFGDLVTNRWWDDLWLNEAFATWTASKTESALRPEWRTRTKAVTERTGAMSTDELASTRAIHAHVGNPKQASEMFDA
jgi:puromycin-sensitive aminopeptidase